MKATGAEIGAFLTEPWEEGLLFEGEDADLRIYDDAGVIALIPTELYDLSRFGWIRDEINTDWDGETFETAFKRWRKKQTHASVVVEVPKDDMAAVMNMCKMRGWRVVR